jgi:hypothetical protein
MPPDFFDEIFEVLLAWLSAYNALDAFGEKLKETLDLFLLFFGWWISRIEGKLDDIVPAFFWGCHWVEKHQTKTNTWGLLLQADMPNGLGGFLRPSGTASLSHPMVRDKLLSSEAHKIIVRIGKAFPDGRLG